MDHVRNEDDIEIDNHGEVLPHEANIKKEQQETVSQKIKEELEEKTGETSDEDQCYDFSDLLSVNIKTEPVLYNPEYGCEESSSNLHSSLNEETPNSETFTCDDQLKSVYEGSIHSSSNSYGNKEACVLGEDWPKSSLVENKEEDFHEADLNIINLNYLHTARSETKIYQCDKCHKFFSRRQNLETHISSIHDGNRFECKECNKIFCHKISLRNHVKVIHRGIKSYKCDMCNMMFAQMISLRTHITATHKRIKNHECNVCHKTFYDLASVNRHVNNVHKGIKYECKECHKLLSDVGSLKKHYKGVHKMI